MTRITNRDDFRAALLSAAASEGATGYISYAPGSQDAGGMQSLGRILPVYVPSDTTRIRTACKK